MTRRTILLFMLLVVPLAGCTQPEPAPEPIIVTDSIQIGRTVAALSSTPYNTNPTNVTRNVKQPFEVQDNETGITVRFDGIFGAERAGANITVVGPTPGDGNGTAPRQLLAEAIPGQPDDDGRPIGAAFAFDRKVDLVPGRYTLMISGHGLISTINMHAIAVPVGTTQRAFAFQVPADGRLEATVQAIGIGGEPPIGFLERPDDAPLTLRYDENGAARLSARATAGTHTFTFESRDWAGTVGIHVAIHG